MEVFNFLKLQGGFMLFLQLAQRVVVTAHICLPNPFQSFMYVIYALQMMLAKTTYQLIYTKEQ